MHVFISILFILFGLVQYNDPDFYIWVPVYFATAGLSLGYHFKKGIGKWALGLTLIFGISMLLYIPEMIDWIKKGLPSITGSMKAETPFVEFVREFFGLLLCFITCMVYWKKSRNLFE